MKIILFANTDWYLYNHRLALAKTLKQKGHKVILLSPEGDYVTQLQQAGFQWLPFNFSRTGSNPFSEVLTIYRLLRLYKQQKPDAVHHFTIKCVLYGSIAARLTGIKKIINAIPGLGFVFIDQSFLGKIRRLIVKTLYKLAINNTIVIFQNPDDQTYFFKNNLLNNCKHTLIKSSGVNTDIFTPQPEAQGIPIILLSARMLWPKGIQEFVEAAKILKRENIKARFVLIGDSIADSPNAVPKNQLIKWQQEGPIEWWGWTDDILSVLKKIHIACLPSYYGEGVPRSLVEAAACARPLIATDMPGCREIVRHNQNGLLIPPRDAQALAQAVQKLVLDPNLRLTFGKHSREIVLAEFSQQIVMDRTIELYS